MLKKTKISAIIPVGNEITNIEAAIKSVDFADEIVVVDSFSTDGTYEKAIELGTRVIRREYDYPASQKNWAIPQATHEWVFILDADERVSLELKKEIISTIQNENHAAYWVGRINDFMGKRVNYSGWKNDKVIRLFKRDLCKYEDKFAHEEIVTNGQIGELKNKIYHNTYRGIDDYIRKIDRYAWLQAKDYDKKTGKLTLYHFLLKPFWGFFKHYIVQSGFRDGFVGITIAYLQGYAVFMRYVKLWLIRKNRI